MTDAAAPGGARERVGFWLGPLLAATLLLQTAPDGLTIEAWRTAALAVLMATWWITEAIPIPATALLPLVLLPLLGIQPIGDAAPAYANPIIFLFMGGFLIAAGFEKSGLHLRLALNVIRLGGVRPANLIGAFMIATAFLSMWVSNTATTAMMLPLAISIVALATAGRAPTPGNDNFAVALLLGLAYGASIGGLATLIGSPPNALFAGFINETYGIQITFLQWMMLGVPLVAVGLPCAWWLLTRRIYPVPTEPIAGGQAVIADQLRRLGPLSRAEWMVAGVGVLTAAAWITRPLLTRFLPGLSDAGIAIAGALLLFLLPVDWRKRTFVLDWASAERLPWGVLVLFGGGLSLAGAIATTGLAAWIGDSLEWVGGMPTVVVTATVTTVVVFLTELTSNTATAAAFLPVVAALAVAVGLDPVLLAAPAALAATCAFMLPVATPPNAIVYGTGRVSIRQMIRAGLLLNLLFVGLITAVVVWLGPYVLGSTGG